MPYSKSVFDETIEAALRELQPRTVLDVGAGAGKYAALVRRAAPGAVITGVEMDLEYIERFDLSRKYDRILAIDAADLIEDTETSYDAIILGDVIEHLRKSVAIDLLNFFVYRSQQIFVVFPLRFLQGAVGGRKQEAHISVWGRSDFAWCDSTYEEKSRLALVRIAGFLAKRATKPAELAER